MNADDLLARLKAEGLSPSLKLRVDGETQPSSETLELVHQHKPDLLIALADAHNIPRLPWQLERLLAAANSDSLPKGLVRLENGVIFDLQKHVLTVASSYLISDRSDALHRLWIAHRAWQREEAN